MSIEDIERCTCSNPECMKELTFGMGEAQYTLKRSIWVKYCNHCRRTVNKDDEFSFCSVKCLRRFIKEYFK